MSRKYLVTGANGQLGRAFIDYLGESAAGLDLPDLDITDLDSIRKHLNLIDPEYILNCAAVTGVDLCQRDRELAHSVHHAGVGNLASTGRKLITFSTDHVFGGDTRRRTPYLESDQPSPVNIYAESKLCGEVEALAASGRNIVVRTSWLWKDRGGLVPYLWNSLERDGSVKAVSDQMACAAYAPDVVRAVMGIVETGGTGIFHVVNGGAVSPATLAGMFLENTGGEVEFTTWKKLGLDAPRPLYSVLGTSRGIQMPDLKDAISRWRKSFE